MGTHVTKYKVNVKYVGEKTNEQISAAYTQFYIGVVSRVLKTSNIPTEKKIELLDRLIQKHS